MDLAWGKEIHLSLDLNEEPMEGNNVDDQPTPIMKLPQAREYAQLLSNFTLEHPLELSIINVINMQYWARCQFSTSTKHDQKAIESYLCSVWYGEDIIMGTMF